MFTLEIEGKSRIQQKAIMFWKCPHTTTAKEGTRSCGYNQERLFTSQEKTAASRARAGATDCKEVLKKKRGKRRRRGRKEGRMGSSWVWQKWSSPTGEDRGIYMHNFTWIKSLCQICDALWWILILQWLILSDSCWGIKAVIFKKLYVLLDALYK